MRKAWLFASVVVGIFTMSQAVLAQGPTVWVPYSTLLRVAPTDPPGATRTAVLHAGRGEYQSFQVAVQAAAGGLTNLNFSVSDLHKSNSTNGSSSDQIISKKNLILYREKYMTVLQHSPTWQGPPNLPITDIDTFPDVLIPFIDPATGQPPVGGTYIAAPLNVEAGQNTVFWVDVLIPRNATAGEYFGIYTVTSDQGTVRGRIDVHVWNFTLPREPYLKSAFNAAGANVKGLDDVLLSNKLMPVYVQPWSDEPGLIKKYGHFATDLLFYDGTSYGQCTVAPPPSLAAVEQAKAAQAPGLYLYDDSADSEGSCTSQEFYNSVIQWAQVFHKAGVDNLMSQEPVPQLYDDGLGKGRSAVDIWAMLPLSYNDAQAKVPPAVTFVLKKGDAVWSYNDAVQDSYSPKWELDFPPIDYRIQPGFINQSLGITGLLYWSVDNWPSDPWQNPQGGWNPDYPGEGVLIYPGAPAGLQGVAPSMRLKYLRDGVQDYGYIQILKNCGQGEWALHESRKVGRDWTNWTRDPALLESVRLKLGNKIAALGCSR